MSDCLPLHIPRELRRLREQPTRDLVGIPRGQVCSSVMLFDTLCLHICPDPSLPFQSGFWSSSHLSKLALPQITPAERTITHALWLTSSLGENRPSLPEATLLVGRRIPKPGAPPRSASLSRLRVLSLPAHSVKDSLQPATSPDCSNRLCLNCFLGFRLKPGPISSDAPDPLCLVSPIRRSAHAHSTHH